jgi:octaprenyl-diphosphate synthase
MDSLALGALRPPRVVLEPLESLASGRGLDDIAARLRLIGRRVGPDLASVEAALQRTAAEQGEVRDVVHHLLDLGGKRLRPMCLALAARAGTGFGPAARELAVAVELVHSATLMHDDVVDLGERRRGAPAARLVYGNAASIFAGDYMLVDALRRVRFAGIPGLLERMLGTIEQMIVAEMRQLRARGSVHTRLPDYLAVVEGKTAALFRWALYAGARAGGLAGKACTALERYGRLLGIAFQVVDDVLDLAGDPKVTGKALHADLREGKMTFPLIVAAERDPCLGEVLTRIAAPSSDAAPAPEDLALVVDHLRATGALDESRLYARRQIDAAIEELRDVPAGFARESLTAVAEAALQRSQ